MRLLDLFCGAGGAAMGYSRAGFDEIVGVDIEPQPRYPFHFIKADALTISPWLVDFDLIHASPPCQSYSVQTVMHDRTKYPDLVAVTRTLLQLSGRPYVIENVPGSPLIDWVQICGSGLGMERLRRHRWFEASFALMSAGCVHGINREPLGVTGHSENGRTYQERKLPHGLAARREAMGIDWMTRDELTEAIPPAYTEYVGRQFLDQLARL